MRVTYQAQKQSPRYQKLISKTPVLGIYVRGVLFHLAALNAAQDDHDYGLNNGGEEYNDKVETKKLLLEFLDEDPASERWVRDGA